VKLESDDFELFGIPRRFAQDRAYLDTCWRKLQAQVHPDRFAVEGASAQRLAMQWAVRINEAYERLKDPLKRAAYLCELHGEAIGATNNTAMPAEFLVRQMQWRESLDEAASLQQVRSLEREVADAREGALRDLQHKLDSDHDFGAAAQQVRALMFVERFAHDVDQRLESLGQ
jgi:molecular chaperone HscB